MSELPALRAEDRDHVDRLMAAWGMVADFCFADLLLLVPVTGRRGHDDPAFEIVGQIRPTTSQTLYSDDLVGRIVPFGLRPIAARALELERVLRGEEPTVDGSGRIASIECIPVRRKGGPPIAVVAKEFSPDAARRPGRLELVYLEISEHLATMIAAGDFPFAEGDDESEAPRVGDGVVVLDSARRVVYASPNAVSALHRMGVHANTEQRTLAELGVGAADAVGGVGTAGVADSCYARAEPFVSEIQAGRAVVRFHAMPLLASGRVIGAIVLLRDVTDIRRRDRQLRAKDTTIREVHHRVKNNLQTISALLRLQGRRLSSPEAKLAIEESVRRIRSIALVHETLSRDVADTVPFDEIVRPLVRIVEESLSSPERRVSFMVEGDAGELPAEVATPLAVVLTELLQNAVEHAFPAGPPRGGGRVVVTLDRAPSELRVVVRDNGVGLPAGFSPSASSSLGLSIVRTLVTSELGGAIAFRTEGGAVVELRLPTSAQPRVGADRRL